MSDKFELWSHQKPELKELILEEGRITVKRKYIKDKYGQQAEIFLTAYDFFVQRAKELISRPQDAEYPFWAAIDRETASSGTEGVFLRLEVPADQTVFFSASQWNQILNLEYLSEDQDDRKDFKRKLESMGLSPGETTDILLSPHYPLLKAKIKKSWQDNFKLARNPERIEDNHVKAALWELKRNWLI